MLRVPEKMQVDTKQDPRLEIVDELIRYYDACENNCNGLCFVFSRLTKKYILKYDWYSDYIRFFRPIVLGVEMTFWPYYWPTYTYSGVESRREVIREIKKMIEADIEKEKQVTNKN